MLKYCIEPNIFEIPQISIEKKSNFTQFSGSVHIMHAHAKAGALHSVGFQSEQGQLKTCHGLSSLFEGLTASLPGIQCFFLQVYYN